MRNPVETIFIEAVVRKVKKVYRSVSRLYLVGSRSRRREAMDLDFVAVVPEDRTLSRRNATLEAWNMKVNIFFSRPKEVDPHIIEYGLGMDIVRWKRAAIKLGMKLNRYGLHDGSKVYRSMRVIASRLGMKLKSHLVQIKANPL